MQQNYVSPIGVNSSPSYADITKKKMSDSSTSSDEDSTQQLSKKAGRKPKKEAERLKMQGSQSTIEIPYGRSKRTRPPKGVITPSHLGK